MMFGYLDPEVSNGFKRPRPLATPRRLRLCRPLGSRKLRGPPAALHRAVGHRASGCSEGPDSTCLWLLLPYYIYICIHTNNYMCMYIHMFVYIYICICVCIYIYTHSRKLSDAG